jgi:sugar transferase (PEP-CTERM/EpsH1 system associated)
MTRPIHVVHVLHSLAVGGTEGGVINLIRSLGADMQHTVIAVTTLGPLAARVPAGVAVHCVGKRPGWDLPAMIRLVRLIGRLRPQVVHTRNWGAFDAVLAARLTRVPVVIHGEHGREAEDPAGLGWRRNRLRRLFAPLIDRFVAVSLELGRWLVDVVGISPARVVTIHNGVDAKRFSDEEREHGRRVLNLAPDAIAIGTVGRLDPVKDQMGLLEAFAGIAAAERGAVLIIAGDGPCRAALEERARQADLVGRVRLLGERSDIPRVLGALDIFVLPSIAEGISNTILEAMATGLPVVATRTGGNPELVEDGVTGTLVPVGDRAALAAAVSHYVTDLDARALHGKSGRQRAMEHFELNRMAQRYRDLYTSLVVQKRR